MNKFGSIACGVLASLALMSAVKAQSPDEQEFPENKIIQSCFDDKNLFGCAVRADNNPKSLGASRPASFSYTVNNDGDDSFSVQAAIKTQHDLGPAYLSFKAQWNKNNQQKKEQDNLKLGVGLEFEFTNIDDVFDRWIESGRTSSNDFWSIYLDADAAYNRKAIFGNAAAPQCVAAPDLRACRRQFLETLRLSLVAAPYLTQFESKTAEPGSSLYYVFAPTIGFFYDEALNDDVILLSGDAVDGGVVGISADATVAISPRVFQNKWELSVSGQIIQAFSRDDMRKEDFEETSRLITASLSYALAGSYVGKKDKNTWLPAFSVSYTRGSDSLKGRASQDTVVFGLTLKY